MVLPKNFDNPDKAFAIAKAYAENRERQLLGIANEVTEQPKQETETNNDQAQ